MLVAVRRLGELRRAAGVDGAELAAMPRAGGEHGGIAAERRPLDVAAQVGDDRVGAGSAQRLGLALGPYEGAHGVPAIEQQRDDPAAETPVGARH